MMQQLRPLYPNRRIATVQEVYAPHILNIFSDASTRNTAETNAAAYAAVAVCMDTMIDSVVRIHTDSDAAVEELRGLKSALAMACRHRYEFPIINIFSDSLVSVQNVRDRPSYWVFDHNLHTYYTDAKSPVKNMEILAEALALLQDLRRTTEVNIYHVKGHVTTDSNNREAYRQLKIGTSTFSRYNHVNRQVETNLIRYLAAYNGVADILSRSLLYRTNVFADEYKDAVQFELKQDVFF